jgi:ribonuclease BN (tRNA processing enzyme)
MSTRRSFLGACLALPTLTTTTLAQPTAKSRLILLGTAGGPRPSPTRAAPSQVIIVNGAAYVVDCGNGVARQMVLAGVPLSSIRSVFITHQHSDHMADYGNLLWLGWEQGLLTKVSTYGPPPLAKMTRLFLEMNEADIKGRIAEEGRPPFAGQIVPHEITRDGVILQDENVKVTAALVDHGETKPAFAYRFDCPDRSIVISGDTRPSPNLVRLAQGADVLVHEVLYAPALEGLLASTAAFAPKMRTHMASGHTTAEDVGRIASEAGVKTLVLSHFVPSGSTVSDQQWLDAVKPHFSGRIVVGRDLMEL